METLTTREHRWVLLVALLLAVITSAPYFAGFQVAGEDWVFSGLLIGVEDGNSYLAKMLRGSAGDWLFRTPYTVQEQPGVLTFLPYLLLGKLAGGEEIHRQLIGLFHLFRIAAVFAYVHAIYRFVSYFISKVSYRKWATVLAGVGGGLGWLVLPWIGGELWPIPPLSFISPETFGFLGILAVPHLALARAFFLLTLLHILRQIRHDGLSKLSPIFMLLTFLLSPIAGVSLIIVLAAFHLAHLGAATRTRSWPVWLNGIKASLWASALSIPYVLYLAVAYRQQSFLQGWADQNLILSPHLGYYLLAYGLLAVPAVLWLVKGGWRTELKGLLLASWLLILPLLPYLPVGVQRRLPEAGWIALMIAFFLGVKGIGQGRFRQSIVMVAAALTLVAPLLLLLGTWRTALEPAQPAFIPRNTHQAFQELAAHSEVDQVVIANFRSSNQVPAYAPVRVPIGHGPESIGGPELRLQVDRFLSSNHASPEDFLRRMGADWVLYSPGEDAGGLPQNAVSLAGQWGQVRLYRILLEQ